MPTPALTVITHSAGIADALRHYALVKKVILIDKLLMDVDCYSKEAIGATKDGAPALTICSDVKLQIKELRECVNDGNVIIAYEPRLDGICWAQQIGSACAFSTTDLKYVPFHSLRDTDFGFLLSHPLALPAHYPAEWFLLRMCEGTVAANINANLVEAKLPAPFYMQNLYSLYLLYKLSVLCEQVSMPAYQLILRDKLTGMVVGEQVPAPGESGGVVDKYGFQPYALNYEDRTHAEAVLKECTGSLLMEDVQKGKCCELSPGYFPTTSRIFSHLLRNSILPIGAIFNELYAMYASGRLLYPFGYCERTLMELSSYMRPILENKKIPFSDTQSANLHGSTISTVSCIPLFNASTSEDKTVSDYVEAMAVNAFRRNCKHILTYDYYRNGDHYFVVRRYEFPNLNFDAKSALYKIYSNPGDPSRFGVYLHTSVAKDRIPLNTLMGFSTRSPCWIKWFIALHYLLEKGLIAIDGESVCLTKKSAGENVSILRKLYGEIFEDPKFLTFDNIFNNVEEYNKLVTYILAKLPKTTTTSPEILR